MKVVRILFRNKFLIQGAEEQFFLLVAEISVHIP